MDAGVIACVFVRTCMCDCGVVVEAGYGEECAWSGGDVYRPAYGDEVGTNVSQRIRLLKRVSYPEWRGGRYP